MRSIDRYEIEVFADDVPAEEGSAAAAEIAETRAIANLPGMLAELAEGLEEQLPDGWTVTVRSCDDE